jgi:hypothetical protein
MIVNGTKDPLRGCRNSRRPEGILEDMDQLLITLSLEGHLLSRPISPEFAESALAAPQTSDILRRF